MGSSSGGGYASSPSDVKVLMGNIERLAKRYPLTAGGRFGRRGKNAQVVESGDPAATARQFWAALSKGGQIGVLPRGKGDISYFEDGSRIIHRRDTRSNSPAIEIIVVGRGTGLPARQKIHFTKKGRAK